MTARTNGVGPNESRVVITGGTGFIGTALARRLAEHNEVVLFDREVERTSYALSDLAKCRSVKVVLGDILDADAVERVVDGADYVVHLAAVVGVNKVREHGRETIETNFLGAHNLIKSLQHQGSLKRFVYFSTSEVFGVNAFRAVEGTSNSIGPVQEARWSYSVSKLAVEHLVHCYHREAGFPSVIIRPFNVFGPGRLGDHAMLRFVAAAVQSRPLVVHGTGDQIRSWCYIDDLAEGVVRAMIEKGAVGEDFNIGNPKNTLTIYELAKRVVAVTGSTSAIRFETNSAPDIDVRVPRLLKARDLLGFDPQVEIEEGIRRTAEWCRLFLRHLPPEVTDGHRA